MDDNLQKLLHKLKEGSISEQEKAILDNWYLKEAQKKSAAQISIAELKEDLATMKTFKPVAGANDLRPSWKYWYAAAAVLLVALFTLVYYIRFDRINEQDKIVMGGNKAKLVLANGEVVDLASVSENDSLVMNGVTIYKSGEGIVSYQGKGNGTEVLSYDEISTPRGGEFKIVLVDGTKVYLNANSSLKFFNALNSPEREVWLQGEAYFEVEHNKDKPFLVHTNEQNIRVLGTTFNVKTTVGHSQTTLIEGSVSLRNGAVKLQPGEQLTTENGVDKPVISVDTDAFLAWKEGYFLFNDEPLEDVMQKIADWYDVDVEFKNHVKKEKIWATVSKYRDINEVLKMIELTGTAHFKIEGRRIIVQK